MFSIFWDTPVILTANHNPMNPRMYTEAMTRWSLTGEFEIKDSHGCTMPRNGKVIDFLTSEDVTIALVPREDEK